MGGGTVTQAPPRGLGTTILTPWFVLLHVPKTGGTFLRRRLRHELPHEWQRPTPRDRAHLRWEELPDDARRLPVLAYVRNPWDWYVSRYHYARERRRAAETAAARWTSFADSLQRACPPAGADRMTRAFDLITGGSAEAGVLTVGRYERLVDDLVAFLRDNEVPLDAAALGERLRAAPRVRASRHRGYQAYYTPELRDLVAERCALVSRYGYRF